MSQDVPSSTSLAELLARQGPVGEQLQRLPYRELSEALKRLENQFASLVGPPLLKALSESQQWPIISATFRATQRAAQASELFAGQARISEALAVSNAQRALQATEAFARFQQIDRQLHQAVLNASQSILLSAGSVPRVRQSDRCCIATVAGWDPRPEQPGRHFGAEDG